jgi:hypothetical protein
MEMVNTKDRFRICNKMNLETSICSVKGPIENGFASKITCKNCGDFEICAN